MSVIVKEGGNSFSISYQDRTYGGAETTVLKADGDTGAVTAGKLSVALDGSVTIDGMLYQSKVVLTNAQMLALRATPVTVVPAVGAGKAIEFVSAVLMFNRTAAYTETADNMAIKLNDGSGTAVSATIEATNFVDAAGDAITYVGPAATAPILTAAGEISNAKLVIHNTGDGEYGGGNAANTVTVIVNYRVHTTAF